MSKNEEFENFLKSGQEDEWLISAKKALDWFLTFIDDDNWTTRKKAVVQYFNDQQSQLMPNSALPIPDIEDDSRRVAFFEDWIAWYLYLVESAWHRPFIVEPSQSARINAIFASIGRHLDLAKNIVNIEKKLDQLLNGKENQPDSFLFEILIAIMYARNGWSTEFLPEISESKTPDLIVTKGDQYFYVECKRQAQVTEYSKNERIAWRKRWTNLVPIMQRYKIPVFIDVTFKVELDSTSENLLADSFSEIVRNDWVSRGKSLETNMISMSANHIDMEKVSSHFKEFRVRWNSPQMIALFAGEYDSSYGYTQIHSPTEIWAVGADDDEHTLNLFCGGVSTAYCAKWECTADESINKKAKDVKKLLSRAIVQVPEKEPSIIHIGYETLHGPVVEFNRSEKIKSSINQFDFKGRNVKVVYCHAIQPSTHVESFECAETTLHFGLDGIVPLEILRHDLLLDEPGTPIKNDTHWNEDLSNRKKRGRSL